jgi:hypothetical protein
VVGVDSMASIARTIVSRIATATKSRTAPYRWASNSIIVVYVSATNSPARSHWRPAIR